MNQSVKELYEQAATLPPRDRAELAGLLLESLEPERDADVQQAWAAEIERRLDDYRAGRMETLSWSEVRAHLHRSNR